MQNSVGDINSADPVELNISAEPHSSEFGLSSNPLPCGSFFYHGSQQESAVLQTAFDLREPYSNFAGADELQPAPVAVSQQVVVAEMASDFQSGPFQRSSCPPLSSGGSAGLLDGQGDQLPPRHEHSTSTDECEYIENKQSVSVKFQNLRESQSQTVKYFDIPTLQQPSKNIVKGHSSLQDLLINTDKMLYLNELQKNDIIADNVNSEEAENNSVQSENSFFHTINAAKIIDDKIENYKKQSYANILAPHIVGPKKNNIIADNVNSEEAENNSVQSENSFFHTINAAKIIDDKIENSKKQSYANILAPPNVGPATTGSSPDCGVMVERLSGCALDSYAWAVTNVVGQGSIAFIGRAPKDDAYILIFTKTPKMAEQLVQRGIWVRNRWLNVSYFQQPATRITVSGVLPFIPDSLIIEACTPHGTSVYPILRRIPAGIKHQSFRGAYSYRRELFLIRKDPSVEIPEHITLSFLGVNYQLEMSTVGAKCYGCGSLSHSISRCLAETNPHVLQPSVADNPILQDPPQPRVVVDSLPVANLLSVSKLGQGTSGLPNINKVQTRNFFVQCNLDASKRTSEEQVSSGNPKQRLLKVKGPKIGLISKKSRVVSKSMIPPIVKDKVEDICTDPVEGSMDIVTEQQSVSTHSESSVLLSSMDGECEVKRPKKKGHSLSILDVVLESNKITDSSALDFQIAAQNFISSVEGQSDKPLEFKKVQKKKKKSSSRPSPMPVESEHSSSVLSPLPERAVCIQICEKWCEKVKFLKVGPRKQLASQFDDTYPNLVPIIKSALVDIKTFPSYSTKYKKVQELLQDLNDRDRFKGSVRISNKRQLVVDPSDTST